MKKIISIAAAILTLGTGGTLAWQSGGTASACGLPNCLQTPTHSHSVCVVSNCAQSINHEHGGIIYYAHHESDGHDHKPPESMPAQVSATQASTFRCDVSTCAVTVGHTHILCDKADCTLASDHSHNDMIYFGHNDNDGHNHNRQNAAGDTILTTAPYNCGVSGCLKSERHDHAVCNQPGCDKTTNHEHNGLIYYGHNNSDGHAYHNCGVSGCMQANSHNHNSCGVNGCNNTGNHSHDNKNGGHKSGHGGGHH